MTQQTPFTQEGLPPMPDLAEMQHWAWVGGRMQQMWLEFLAEMAQRQPNAMEKWADPAHWQDQMMRLFGQVQSSMNNLPDMTKLFAAPPANGLPDTDAASAFWQNSLGLWQGFLGQIGLTMPGAATADMAMPPLRKDRRFSAPQWQSHPMFVLLHQSYLLMADYLLQAVESGPTDDPAQQERMRFSTQVLVDAMSPANFAVTNPQVLEKALETRGESLLKGMQNMLDDLKKGQLTHTDPNAFELGRNLAVTPGKVVFETPLFQLIQYSPTTSTVLETPLLIFPPWINRFYILDLSPEKSFIRWAVEQGLTVFMVSWKSADASMADLVWDDYIRSQIEAIDHVRSRLDVPSVHTIGYCVAGTTLAATLAVLARRDRADIVKSATFFTAQVDFAQAGDLKFFIDDQQMAMVDQLSADGYLDGRYMACTFNLLRGRDLIWNYVVNNYLMGNDYPPFDLLHWNGDTTNLPARWHRAYLEDLYRDNRLVQPDSLSADGTPIDLRLIKTPSYIQAGREDHIAPASSVWQLTRHLSGPNTFLLAGSGHIAGVVNPPSSGKYQYWTNDAPGLDSLDSFVAGAYETPGSWWPHWIGWIRDLDGKTVAAKGKRKPGGAKDAVIEDAPGRYVRMR